MSERLHCERSLRFLPARLIIASILALNMLFGPLQSLAAETQIEADAKTKTHYLPGACPLRDENWFDPERMQCGSLVVNGEDFPAPMRLPVLRIASTASTGASKKIVKPKPPVMFLNGGPGGAGILDVEDWLQHPLLRDHDLILFDGRATGRSTPALCPDLGRRITEEIMADLDQAAEAKERADAVDACLDRAGLDAAGGLVSTAAAVQDIEAIRRAFGDERLSLYGVSYGTRTAMTYAAAYPQRVSALILDSPVPPSASYYEDIPATFDAALAALFAACRQDTACNRRYPALQRRYEGLIERLNERPLHIRMPASATHRAGEMVLNARDLRLMLHQLMYGREFIPVLPALIDMLSRDKLDDFPLLFEIAVAMRIENMSFPAYYLTLSGEDGTRRPLKAAELAVFDSDPVVFERLRKLAASAPQPPLALERIAMPVLLLSGAKDPITAPAYARNLASTLAQARLLAFADSGHALSFSESCATEAIARFLRAAERPDAAMGADLGCVGLDAAPKFVVDHLDNPNLTHLIQRMLLARSIAPLAPLGVVVLCLALLAALFAYGVARKVWRWIRKKPAHGVQFPLSAVTCIGACASAALLTVWCIVLIAIITGPQPAVLLVGIPAFAVWPLRIAFLVLSGALLFMLLNARTQWRSTGRSQRTPTFLNRASFAIALCASGVLTTFMLLNRIAWL
jgi:pimeloyl-ACP methyl ester carboxylesterase